MTKSPFLKLFQLSQQIAGDKAIRLPSLWVFSDPERLPEPENVAAGLFPGTGLVYRHFGAGDRQARAARLAQTCARVGAKLLIGDDDALAEAVDADGVHLPERGLARAEALRAAHPGWLLTGAVHNAAAAGLGQNLPLDAVFVSAVFASRSPSAGAPLGLTGFGALAGASGKPAFALGGVTVETAAELIGAGAAGIAVVEAAQKASETMSLSASK